MNAVPLDRPGTHSRPLAVDGHDRLTLAHVPQGDVPAAGWPLLVMLPGAGASADWTLDETGWAATADRARFLLAVPEALPLDPAAPASFLKNPLHWDDGSPRARTAGRRVDDVRFLTAVLDDLERHAPIDRRRVFVTGFSSGAAMTFRLATALAPRLAGIAPVAGYCWPDDPRPGEPVPTLYLVGDSDPFVPPDGGRVTTPWGPEEDRPPARETVEKWRRALGCGPGRTSGRDGDVSRVEYVGEARRALLVECTVAGLGHHWPGGRGQLSRRLFGPPRPELSGNELIWEWFARVV